MRGYWLAVTVLTLGIVVVGCSDSANESAKVGSCDATGDDGRSGSYDRAEADFSVGDDCDVVAGAAEGPPAEPSMDAEPAREYPRVQHRRNRHIQSGTLTAGSLDDHERFDDYRQFVSEALQNDGGEVLPRLAIGRRVVIRVNNGGGSPIGDARVVVRPADPPQQTGPALLDVTTASDGRALLLTGRDRTGSSRFRVTVEPPQGGQPVTRVIEADEDSCTITLSQVASQRPGQLDLALVIDTTGSMSDELEYLKVEIDAIAATVHRMFPNVDQRFALVVYRDEGDEYVTRTFDFTGSLSEFRTRLAGQSANGGGDSPEAMHVALQQAEKLDWRSRNTARVMFLVADAPPHERFAGQTLAAVQRLQGKTVRVYPVAASGTEFRAEFVLRATSFLTMGQYLFLTDHSGVGNPHAEPHVPDYQVEHLNRLMIRMIASELSGRHLATDQVLAIEDGHDPVEGAAAPDPEQAQASADQASVFGFRFSPAWLLLAGMVLLVCVVDAWEKRRDRPDVI